jgi:hypothetical protein
MGRRPLAGQRAYSTGGGAAGRRCRPVRDGRGRRAEARRRAVAVTRPATRRRGRRRRRRRRPARRQYGALKRRVSRRVAFGGREPLCVSCDALLHRDEGLITQGLARRARVQHAVEGERAHCVPRQLGLKAPRQQPTSLQQHHHRLDHDARDAIGQPDGQLDHGRRQRQPGAELTHRCPQAHGLVVGDVEGAPNAPSAPTQGPKA